MLCCSWMIVSTTSLRGVRFAGLATISSRRSAATLAILRRGEKTEVMAVGASGVISSSKLTSEISRPGARERSIHARTAPVQSSSLQHTMAVGGSGMVIISRVWV